MMCKFLLPDSDRIAIPNGTTIRTEATERMNSLSLRRACARLLTDRQLVYVTGGALAVAFVAGPTVLAWWLRLFV